MIWFLADLCCIRGWNEFETFIATTFGIEPSSIILVLKIRRNSWKSTLSEEIFLVYNLQIRTGVGTKTDENPNGLCSPLTFWNLFCIFFWKSLYKGPQYNFWDWKLPTNHPPSPFGAFSKNSSVLVPPPVQKQSKTIILQWVRRRKALRLWKVSSV